jgi:Virulence-associated protein E
MTEPVTDEKAGAASTAAGPLDTEFVHPVTLDSSNQEPSLEENFNQDASSFPDLAADQPIVVDHTAPASSLDVRKAEGKLQPEEPVPNVPLVPSPSGSITGSRQNADWKQFVHSGVLRAVRWDEFTLANTIKRNGHCVVIERADITWLINECEASGFSKIPFNEFEKQLELIARNNRFDSAKEWLLELPEWDGKERVKHFLPDYLGTGSSRYFEAVGLYIWTAPVARILVPGCQVDMVPVIVGRQGLGKSSLLRLLAPIPDFFGEACLTDSPYQLSRKVLGKTHIIWEELAGIGGRKDADNAKIFITSRTVELSSRVKRGLDTFDRRFVIFGTSNRKDFLRDPTGHRRYLPFESTWVDLKKFEKDKLQFWAEALEIVKNRQSAGKTLVAYEDAERLAEAEYQEFMHQARWYGDPDLHKFLDAGSDKFRTEEALNAVHLHMAISKSDRNEMANTLRQLGYKYHGDRSIVAGRKPKVWHKPKPKVSSRLQTT